MPKVSTNISIDAETKTRAQALLSEFGMDLSTAVNIFLKQMVYTGAFPFEITRNTPNKATLDALAEYQSMKNSPENYKRYDNVNDMLEDILSET